MKLGFNWQRGPFEMIDAIGGENLNRLIRDAGLKMPSALQSEKPFYQVKERTVFVRDSKRGYVPISLPEG